MRPPNDDALEEARRLQRAGRLGEAAALLRSLRAGSPHDADLAHRLALVLFRLPGGGAEAAQLLRQAAAARGDVLNCL